MYLEWLLWNAYGKTEWGKVGTIGKGPTETKCFPGERI